MKIEILCWSVKSVKPSLFLSIGFWYKKWFIPRRLVFCPIRNLIPRSEFTSPQEDEKLSLDYGLTFSGTFVIKFIIPPIASDPYKVEEGPFIISICWIKDCGIPVKP